jgi:hypothetical protein
MRTYEQLAEYVLATLRIDTRCRTIHFLDLAMRRVQLIICVFALFSLIFFRAIIEWREMQEIQILILWTSI